MQEVNCSEPNVGKHDPELICSQLVNAILIFVFLSYPGM